MKNKYLLILIIFSFSSCKDRIEKRIEIINNINDSLMNVVSNIKDKAEAESFNLKIESLGDSVNSIRNDKGYKKGYLKKTITNLDSLRTLFKIRQSVIFNRYASEKITGKYEGNGRTYGYLKNWGKLPNGVIFTKININKTGRVSIDYLFSTNKHWANAEAKISNCIISNDTLIKGKFIDNKGVVCEFEWNENKLSLQNNNWDSENKLVK